MTKTVRASFKQILIVMFLFGMVGSAVPEESLAPVRAVRLSSQAAEPSGPSFESGRGLAAEEADDYTSTLVGGPLVLAFFYAIVSFSARPDPLSSLA
jgi:hypothetical protein